MIRLISFLTFIVTYSIGLCQNDTIFSKNGKIIEIGTLVEGKREGKWISYHENAQVESEGLYKNDKKTGEWTWYYDNGTLCCKEKYKNHKFKKGEYWEENGKSTTKSEIDINPEYPGGIDAFRKMVSDNLQYPEDARQEGIEGNVFLEFDINKNGELVNINVIRGVHPSLDNEAIRVVSLSEKWTPSSMCGKPVKAGYVFPVVFVLY